MDLDLSAEGLVQKLDQVVLYVDTDLQAAQVFKCLQALHSLRQGLALVLGLEAE